MIIKLFENFDQSIHDNVEGMLVELMDHYRISINVNESISIAISNGYYDTKVNNTKKPEPLNIDLIIKDYILRLEEFLQKRGYDKAIYLFNENSDESPVNNTLTAVKPYGIKLNWLIIKFRKN
jgi:hypothetical protein